MDLLKYIELGTNAKEWFNYDGNPLPLRPLSSYELDTIMLTVLKEGINQSTFEDLQKVKLNIKDKKIKIDLSDKDKYAEFFKYYNEIDYWIVYHAMKDFQDDTFTMPDYKAEFSKKFKDWKEDIPRGYYIVRQMKYVHDISKDVMYMTSQPSAELIEILRNDEGKVLASRVFVLNMPLVSEAWKATPLQTDFLYYARPGAPILLKDESELPGIKAGTMEEVMNQLKKLGIK